MSLGNKALAVETTQEPITKRLITQEDRNSFSSILNQFKELKDLEIGQLDKVSNKIANAIALFGNMKKCCAKRFKILYSKYYTQENY